MATVTIVLFNIQFNAYGESLEVSMEKLEVSKKTYETLHAKDNGTIIGKDLNITGNKDINSNPIVITPVVKVEGANSVIELIGSTIKGESSDITVDLEAKDSGTLKISNGTITVSKIGASFSNSDKNTLENVKISSNAGNAPMDKGISANKSNITLNNVTITQAKNSIFADDQSQITILGGSFDGETDGIYAT
ncbi:hypothetical protein O9A_01403 [Bartonella koehlerae C-29]|uniref:Uncharacterized protein n=2 Tax=Bartonella koehlerae TaxID=92181 RepID=A0A067W4W2_9HYPH|nr:hypothetical protein O9A_01403 [Bartonella koehlerae C-29]